MAALVRLGVILTMFGVGSLILPMFNMQFRVMMWADPAQPFLGIALALAGVALLIVPKVLASRGASPAEQPAPVYGPPLTEGTPAQFAEAGRFAQPAPVQQLPPQR